MTLQSFTICALLLSWLAMASRIPQISLIALSVQRAMTPLFEVGVIAFLVSTTLGALIHFQIGARVAEWSTPGHALGLLWTNFVIGTLCECEICSCGASHNPAHACVH